MSGVAPPAHGLPADVRRRIETFVRPLYAGLDGVQTFDRVARLEGWLSELGAEALEEREWLELLTLFHGVADRLGRGGAGSRLELFLRSLGVDGSWVRELPAALERIESRPQDEAEELLHDALLLEASGVLAAARRLMLAGKKRVEPARAASRLSAGPTLDRFRTARGRQLAAPLRREAESWIAAFVRSVERAQAIGTRPAKPSS